MRIGGFQKFTLIDFPGRIAATVFTVGCNFRCSFCHNPELVLADQFPEDNISEKDFFDFLEKRKGKLEGICITGGEPTIQPDIVEFIQKIKALKFAVKLDSNGTNPDVLKKLLDKNLLDYVAMDIKTHLDDYEKITGRKINKDRIRKSVNLLINGKVPYEFRTTAVPGLHEESDFEKIASWLDGARAYYLQEYREREKILDGKLKEITQGNKLDLEKIKRKIEKHFGKMEIRR